uniref:Uncharacterized protein n=1 Tax=Solanum tuberosum TaxID=4113 RepID=M1E078_SOLTU
MLRCELGSENEKEKSSGFSGLGPCTLRQPVRPNHTSVAMRHLVRHGRLPPPLLRRFARLSPLEVFINPNTLRVLEESSRKEKKRKKEKRGKVQDDEDSCDPRGVIAKDFILIASQDEGLLGGATKDLEFQPRPRCSLGL